MHMVAKAAEALHRLGDTITGPDMVEWLGHEDPDRRRRAASALAYLGDKRAPGPLIEALRDPDGGVRKEAALSLGHAGDQAAVAALTAALDDTDDRVREAAGRALEWLARGEGERQASSRPSGGDHSVVSTVAEVAEGESTA